MTATEFQLALIDWQFFGTATWRSSLLGSYKSREDTLWEFLRDFCRFRSVIEFCQLPIVVRWERGELGDRPHAHFLLAGLLPRFVGISDCFRANAEWNKRAGFMKLRLFNVHANAATVLASYVTKTPPFLDNKANKYEIAKFDHADRLVINDGAWKRMLTLSHAPYVAQARTL